MENYKSEYELAHPSCKCTSGPVMRRDCPIHGHLVRSTEAREQAATQNEDTARLDWLDKTGHIRGEDWFWRYVMDNAFPYEHGKMPGVQPADPRECRDCGEISNHLPECPEWEPPQSIDTPSNETLRVEPAAKQESAPAAEHDATCACPKCCELAIHPRQQPSGARLTDGATNSHAIGVAATAKALCEILDIVTGYGDQPPSLWRVEEYCRNALSSSSDDSQAASRQTKGT